MTLTDTTQGIKYYEWWLPTWDASPEADKLTVVVARNSIFFFLAKRPLKFCLI